MNDNFERWEGRTVDGRFPLQSYLDGSDHSAVYLTLRQVGAGDSEKAAIKLIPAAADSEKQLLRWKAARERSHPNLIRIFDVGRCELDGLELLYVVEEYAEENLSQILPERALTAEETRGMLPPLLRALQYMHNRGFVHGHIQPSNILAIVDQVKLSSDSLAGAGDESRRATSAYDPPEAATGAASTTSDVWQLGMTLVEVLTQRLPDWDRVRPNAPQVPASIPEPFREIAKHSLQLDAGKRWTVAQILGRLERGGPVSMSTSAQFKTTASPPQIPAPPKASAKWPYFLALAALVAVALFLIARPKPAGPPAEDQSPQAQQSATAENTMAANSPSGHAAPHTESKPSPTTRGETKANDERAPANAHESDIVRRVAPQVSPSARRTIQGTIKVRVQVDVDAAGNVTEMKLESAGPSRYFSRLAMETAREWKFAPVPAGESGAREWTLQFAFSRARTEVSAARTKR